MVLRLNSFWLTPAKAGTTNIVAVFGSDVKVVLANQITFESLFFNNDFQRALVVIQFGWRFVNP